MNELKGSMQKQMGAKLNKDGKYKGIGQMNTWSNDSLLNDTLSDKYYNLTKLIKVNIYMNHVFSEHTCDLMNERKGR